MEPKKFFNKKEQKDQWRIRFQINRKEFYQTADTKKELLEIVDEIKVRERRAKKNVHVGESRGPALADLFKKVLPTIGKRHQRVLCDRVFKDFLALLPKGFRVKELKKSHYQSYIDWRLASASDQTKKPVLRDTVYKELYAISGALSKGELYWDSLEGWEKPTLPKSPEKQKSRQEKRRKRIVSPEEELNVLLDELRKPREGKQTHYHEWHRRRLADDLEFRFLTGLRRKEVARLEKKKYFPKEHALRKVKRWKTGTETPFFPLSRRAEEIIQNRLAAQNGSDSKYIFTEDGEPIPSDYRTLKNVCKKLGITYGRYTEDGFVPHDLRHSFASDVIQHADIETVRELLGHSNVEQTGDYLHTNEKKLREAIRKAEGMDFRSEIISIYIDVKRGKIKAKQFLERIKNLALF